MNNENKKEQNPAPEVSDNNLEGVVGGNGVNDNKNAILLPQEQNPNEVQDIPYPYPQKMREPELK